jgi:hypothetical protein
MRGSRTRASSHLSLICKTVLTEVLQSITSVRFKTVHRAECTGVAVIVLVALMMRQNACYVLGFDDQADSHVVW